MPIHCPIDAQCLDTEEFRSLDYGVMGQMFASHNEIGRLADEQVYRADIAMRLASQGLECVQEVPVNLSHKDYSKTLYLDLVVEQKAVYELKTVSGLNSQHEAQLKTYLYALDLERGKLVNLRQQSVESKYVHAPVPRSDRCGFKIEAENHRGDGKLHDLVVELVKDWGTSLSVSLYRQALVHLLGGEDSVTQMVPMERQGQQLPHQRFHLVESDSAFELTAITNPGNHYTSQLERLLQFSPLHRLHWINIDTHSLTFQTIARP